MRILIFVLFIYSVVAYPQTKPIDAVRVVKQPSPLLFPKSDSQKLMRPFCKNVRLDGKGGVMEKAIETEQIGGTCYAHASATLYDAHRRKNPLKGQTSIKPSSVASVANIFKSRASGYHPNYPVKSLSTGEVEGTLDFLKKSPPCRLISSFPNDSGSALIDKKEYGAWLFQQELLDLKNNPAMKNSNYAKKKYRDICAQAGNSKLNQLTQKKNYADILEAIQEQDSLSILNEAEYFSCRETNKATPFQVNQIEAEDMKEIDLFKLVTSQLDLNPKKATPVAIEFCMDKAYRIPSRDCGHHAAVIIGQRINPKTNDCEFLVQDSGLPSDDVKARVKHASSKSQKIWVNAEFLMRHTIFATYITPLSSGVFQVTPSN